MRPICVLHVRQFYVSGLQELVQQTRILLNSLSERVLSGVIMFDVELEGKFENLVYTVSSKENTIFG